MGVLGWYTAALRCLRRQTRGGLALVLYVLGALVLPAVHIAWHSQPHQHQAHGLRLHPLGAAQLQHAESDAAHEHPTQPPSRDARPPGTSSVQAASGLPSPFAAEVGHGQGSLSHFGLSFLPSQAAPALCPACLLPPAAPLGTLQSAPPPAIATADHGPRGPPAPPACIA